MVILKNPRVLEAFQQLSVVLTPVRSQNNTEQHKLVLFLEMFHLMTVVGIRLSTCATVENAPGKAEYMKNPRPGLAKKKKKREIWK